MRRYAITVIAACILLCAPVFADVIINVKTEEKSATTQPAVDDLSVSVSAVPGHNFAASFLAGHRVIEISGSIQTLADEKYRIKISFSDREGGMASVSTTAELRAKEPMKLSGLQNGSSSRETILTVIDSQ